LGGPTIFVDVSLETPLLFNLVQLELQHHNHQGVGVIIGIQVNVARGVGEKRILSQDLYSIPVQCSVFPGRGRVQWRRTLLVELTLRNHCPGVESVKYGVHNF
jgi:hypothetical protein